MKPKTELERAAVGWWLGKRPLAYDKRMHLKNPKVNTSTSREEKLAIAVAKFLQR